MTWLRIIEPGQREIAYKLPADPDELATAIEWARAKYGIGDDHVERVQQEQADNHGPATSLTLLTVNEALPVDPGYDPEKVTGEWWK